MAKKKSYTLIIIASIIAGLSLICLTCISIGGLSDITQSGKTTNAEAKIETTKTLANNTLEAIFTEKQQTTSTIIPTLNPTPPPIFTYTPTQPPAPTIIGSDCLLDPNPVTAQVLSITDGDTIHVVINGEEFTLRYIGIDTPESVHPSQPVEFFGPEAATRNTELVAGKEVTLYRDISETDQYDRLLRYVVVGDLFVNLSLVEEGYAQASSYPPDTACDYLFSKANQAAKTLGFGMWAQQPETLPLLAQDGNIIITYIYYNGTQGQTEPDEYVLIQNQGNTSVNMDGWRLSDESGKTFIFPNFEINPGQECRIYTNENHTETCGFSFHHTASAIWNNGGDCATLADHKGEIVSKFCY
jgi:micrococcal nuclease